MRAADFTKMVEGDVVRTKFATKQAQKNKDQYQRQPDIEIPLYNRIRNQSVLPKYAYLSKDKLEPFDHFEIQPKSPTATRIIGVTTDSRKVLVSTFMAPPETVEKFVAAMNRGGFSDVPIQRVSIKGYNDTDTKLEVKQGMAEGFIEGVNTQTVSSDYVVHYVADQNDRDDPYEGDVPERINQFSGFKRMAFPIKKLKLRGYRFSPDLAKEYSTMSATTSPPIVVEPNGEIIDGYHRAQAAVMRKDQTIDAFVGINTENVNKQGVTEGLTIDVPNEEWLQDKIDYAKSKGRDEWGAPFFGSTTAYARPNPQVSVVRLELLKGMRNEQNNVRKTDLEWLMARMEKTGKLPLTNQGEEYAPFVMVAYNGEAWVSEGNHRIMAAYRLGWKKMPVEIKYFDGGERVESGIMYPGKIGLK